MHPIDEDLVDHNTVLRAGQALARVIAARHDASLPGAAHDRYAWSRPAIYDPVRSMIEDATGIELEA
ncbi:MAG: hypothetical protein GY788_28400, partial [bacterium]|nr:hypothetical protein [bacterium]